MSLKPLGIWGTFWMKKYRKIGPIIGVILMAFFVLAAFLIKDKYNTRSDQAVYNIVSSLKKKYPDLKTEDLVKMAEEKGDRDLSQYGIYDGKGILSLKDADSYALKVICLVGLLQAGLLWAYLYSESRYSRNTVNRLIDEMEKINLGIYNISFINEEEDLARLQNEMYKITLRLREQAENAEISRGSLKKSLEDISHQIKTPIASINLLLENLKDPDISPDDKKELLDYMQLETDAVTNLVLTLLNIALLESGTINFKKEKINLEDLIDQVSLLMEPISRSKNIKIHNTIKDITYLGDPKWEKELYINLIKNSLEHSKGEEVEVYAAEEKTYLEVCVENLSEPISEEKKSRVFDRYYKLSDKEGNFGIGLNLCKMIAESNNAKIRMETESDKVRFIVRYYKKETL